MTPSSLSSGAGVLFSLDRLPFWSVAAVYVLVALLLGVVVRLATGRSLARIAAHRRTELSRAIATTVPRPAAVAVVLVVLAAGLRLVPREDPQLAQVHRLVAIVLALLGVAVMMRVAFRSIGAFGRSNPELRSSAGIGKAVAWVVGLGVAAVVMSPGFVDGGVGFTVYFHARSFVDQGVVQHALRKRIAARLKKEGVALAQVTAAVIRRE